MDPALTEEILSILNDTNDMTIATVHEDGYPQAATVSYVNDGSISAARRGLRKRRKLACDSKVSLTVNLPYASWNETRVCRLAAKRSLSSIPQRWSG
jgi:hypothetical protein